MEHRGAMLNISEAELSYEGESLELTKNELKILQTLFENKASIVTRDTLMTKLWESDTYVDENTLSVNVNRLRKKLASIGLSDFIITEEGNRIQTGMKLLSGYIKRNLIWLCLIFLITMLHLGYMLLINVKSADIGYSIILDLMITAVVFIIGFVLYAKKVKKLGKILEHPVEEQKELPEPADDIELAYSDIIENHDIARSEAVNHMQKQQSTTKDYYARWVHQIKTPISAGKASLTGTEGNIG